jgi:hypothetical protein
MVSGLPTSPFAAAPQPSMPSLGWGIEWSSAEGRWVAAAQPNAKARPAQDRSADAAAEPHPEQGQEDSIPAAASAPDDSLAQLERTGSVGELSSVREAGKPADDGTHSQQVLAGEGTPADGQLSRQHSAASEVADIAGAEGAGGQPGPAAAAADRGALSRMNSSSGPDSGQTQVGRP